jgi:hypothetical protein
LTREPKAEQEEKMDGTKLLCVDCYDTMERMNLINVNAFYCNNIKCRRFGVLTIGGLCGEKCEKSLIIEHEEESGKKK